MNASMTLFPLFPSPYRVELLLLLLLLLVFVVVPILVQYAFQTSSHQALPLDTLPETLRESYALAG